MAGYLFLLDSEQSLSECIERGSYATKIKQPNGYWNVAAEGTFGDYITMRPGDDVYFFMKRTIYGIGKLVRVAGDCRHLNFPGAATPYPFSYHEIASRTLLPGEDATEKRWVCFFEPSPHFFRYGVDMDDMLASNPKAFRMLRTMWKRSFIKFDDEENQAFRDAILKANEKSLAAPTEADVFPDAHRRSHARASQLASGEGYRLCAAPVVEACSKGELLNHEMALEAGILGQLHEHEESAISAFGSWDYLAHQVVASPFKPIDYMDRMDLFGYRYIPGHPPTISKYMVGEIKAATANIGDIEQVLKYVDWVANEYAHGDYLLIEAYLVAADFSDECIRQYAQHARRMFTRRRRPAQTETWQSLHLVRYEHVGNGLLRFTRIDVDKDAI